MVRHVITSREAKAGWQPALQMDPPVDFFRSHEVCSPANENARADPETEQKIQCDQWNSVAGEEESDMDWRLGQAKRVRPRLEY